MKSYVEIKLIIEQNLLDNSITYYKFLVPVFRELETQFLVKVSAHEEYSEFMTNLMSCGFVNTIEFLSEKTHPDFVELIKPSLAKIDQELNLHLSQTYQTLHQIQNFVMKKEAYLADLESWEIKIYQDFFKVYKTLLASKTLPAFNKLILKLFHQKNNEPFFDEKLADFFFNFKNVLSDKTGLILAKYLTRIYDQYGLVQDEVNLEQTFKEAFTDFDQFNFLQVVDVSSALKLFDLPHETSFFQIQKVYKQLAKKYHPDSHNLTANQAKMEQINVAYQILKEAYQKPEK